MKFKILLIINAILAFTIGVACVLIPARLLAQYDVVLSPMGLVIYQFWGVALIGLGLLTWLAKSITELSLQKNFAFALFITNGLSAIMAIKGQYAGANTSGWSTVTLFLLLAIGFGVFLLQNLKPNEKREEKL